MSPAEFYSMAAFAVSVIAAIVVGIYYLIRCIARAIKRSCERHREAVLRAAKRELWKDASARSLQLDMEMIDAMKRMDSAASWYK